MKFGYLFTLLVLDIRGIYENIKDKYVLHLFVYYLHNYRMIHVVCMYCLTSAILYMQNIKYVYLSLLYKTVPYIKKYLIATRYLQYHDKCYHYYQSFGLGFV